MIFNEKTLFVFGEDLMKKWIMRRKGPETWRERNRRCLVKLTALRYHYVYLYIVGT